MTKIPRSVRERAALLCQVVASNPGMPYTFDIRSAAHRLASDAWWTAIRALVNTGYPAPSGLEPYYDRYAEAECLLRCGWSPGDPVVRP